ncbi:MAG: OmpA family protein [Planctomycetes bacterium]|nr:OmpA family protein [Planctomycetota bacterium]MCB9905058.1 OmpA family protein [Planctomycetota bacterium]
MAKKKRNEEAAPQGAPDWIVTFADMISLLVTFFILMMTFSSLETYDAFNITRDIMGTTGVLTGSQGTSAVSPPEVDLMSAMDAMRGASTVHTRPTNELQQNLEAMGQLQTEEYQPIDLKEVRDGLVITFDERACFAPGSTQLTPYLREALKELSLVLEHYAFLVSVEGHTDGEFKATPRYPTAEALGAARAAEAARWMVSQSSLSPMMVQVATHGMSDPIAPNDDVDGRELNRRVELRLLSMSRTRSAQVETLEGNGER